MLARYFAQTIPQLTHGCTGRQFPRIQVRPRQPRILLLLVMSGLYSRNCLLTLSRSHREVPSGNVFAMPRTCFARKPHPLRISNHPSIRIKVPDLGSFSPRHFLIQSTAVMLSPNVSTVSPPNRGFESGPTTNTHAVMTIRSSSKT